MLRPVSTLSLRLQCMHLNVRAILLLISIVEFIGITIINLLNTGLNLLSPFLVSRIIDFIETKDNPKNAPTM